MKEMKEIKIYKDMLRETLSRCFWELMDARTYFLNELMHSDYMDLTHMNLGYNNALDHKLLYDDNEYVTPELAEKVGNYYKAEQNLMTDISFYLSKNYGISYNKELAKRKAK